MEKETKQCPFCGEEINIKAVKCKHCGEWLEKRIEVSGKKIKVLPKKICPNCGGKILAKAKKCKHCGMLLEDITLENQNNINTKSEQTNKSKKEIVVSGIIAVVSLIWMIIIGIKMFSTYQSLEYQFSNSQSYNNKNDTKIKRVIETLNMALSLNYALEGVQIGDEPLNTEQKVLENLFMKRMSVISTEAKVPFAKFSKINITPISDTNVFYTADGIRCVFVINPASYSSEYEENYYGYMIIDTNGDKGPNKMTTNSSMPLDTYVATIFANKIIPGIVGSNDSVSKAVRELINKSNN